MNRVRFASIDRSIHYNTYRYYHTSPQKPPQTLQRRNQLPDQRSSRYDRCQFSTDISSQESSQTTVASNSSTASSPSSSSSSSPSSSSSSSSSSFSFTTAAKAAKIGASSGNGSAVPVSSESVSASVSSGLLSPHLSTWYQLTKHIPMELILPIGLGNQNEYANQMAFFGDKRLNMEIAQQLLLQLHTPSTIDSSDVPEETATERVAVPASLPSTTSRIPPPVGIVTSRQGIAMSNALFAKYIPIILPYHMTTVQYGNIYSTIQGNTNSSSSGNRNNPTMLSDPPSRQIHDAGTMIEATVDYVANYHHHRRHHAKNDDDSVNHNATDNADPATSSSNNHNNDKTNTDTNVVTLEMINTALTELAQFLIARATEEEKEQPLQSSGTNDATNDDDDCNDIDTAAVDTSTIPTTTDIHNPKGEVLNHGGTVKWKRLDNYPDHAPQFMAIATLGDISGTVHHGRSKRETEQSAAAMVWRYYSKTTLAKKKKQEQLNTTNMSPTMMAMMGNITEHDEEDIENPKGRIISIGGKVTSEKLKGHPEHLPRFKAICTKPFFIVQPTKIGKSDNDIDDDDDEMLGHKRKEKLKYMIEATAEGRTKYEAERIASIIVWRHVMNMSSIPISPTIPPKLVPYVTKDIEVPEKKSVGKYNDDEEENGDARSGWFGEMNEDDPIYDLNDTDGQVVEPKLSATKRRKLRTLKNATERHISTFDIRDTQDNFLQFQLTDFEQPTINLRPGGETVIESWHRGALNPIAAFHRALIAPHVFPNHVGTVNAFTRHNILPDTTLANDGEAVFIDHRKKFTTTITDLDIDDNENRNESPLIDTDVTPSPSSESLEFPINSNTSSNELPILETVCSDLDIGTVIKSPYDDEKIEVAERRDKKYKRTFTVLAFVTPNLNHPLVQNTSDYNNSELMTKIFVEHGYNVRTTRNAIGLKINQYIMDVLLKNYEDLDEMIETERKFKEKQAALVRGLSKRDRKRIFFKF